MEPLRPKIVQIGKFRGGTARSSSPAWSQATASSIDGLVRAIPGTKVAPQDGAIRYDAVADGPRLTQEPSVRLSHIFIDRPIFATVLSVFVTLVGLGALAILPVAQ